MKIKIEEIAHLSRNELNALADVSASSAETLEQFYNEAKARLGNVWFIYRGGSHVALHRESGDSRRCLIAS